MDKSTASIQSQKPSVGRRERVIPAIPRSETMAPLTPQSMVLPTAGASRPTDTSEGSTYLKILEDVMGKFSPTGKMSEVFSQLAKKFKDEEEQRTPTPVGIPTIASVQTDPATAQTLAALTSSQTYSPTTEPISLAVDRRAKTEFKEAVESVEVGGSRKKGESGEEMEDEAQELAEEESEGRTLEVVNVEEEESDDDIETLDERAIRRSARAQRGLGREELVSRREEAAVLLAAKR